MSNFLSHLHADLRVTRLTRRGATAHPDDVPTGLHKKYERMEKIVLPLPSIETPLISALESRRSTTKDQIEPPSLEDWGALLGHGLRKRDSSSSRNYPSGGALYPIETYVWCSELNGKSGVFHYNPSDHVLEYLWQTPADHNIKRVIRKPSWLNPPAIIIFTSVWQRSSAKYGDLAYQHALLEAGHMSQNILLLSSAINIETRPLAGFDDAEIIEMLDVDPDIEQPVHTISVSKATAPQG